MVNDVRQEQHRLADLRMKARNTIEGVFTSNVSPRVAGRELRDLLDEAYKRGALDMAESFSEAVTEMTKRAEAL